MSKKIIVGLLVLILVGGGVFALLDRQNTVSSVVATSPTPAGQGNAGQNQQVATSSVGEVWNGSGTILNLTEVGMTLQLQDGSEIYVELGSTEYLKTQSVTLNAGETVTVDGFFNGTNYHARTVTTPDGAVLALRNESGQPLWSGGNGSGSGANGGQGEVQIPADQWITVEGTVTALSNNGLVLQTTDGQALTVSFGRADFWQTQAVTFAVNDSISMLGFWQADVFNPGQVTKTATGERILLRDPNGRPLWAGPGRGQGSGQSGQAQHVTPQPTATASS